MNRPFAFRVTSCFCVCILFVLCHSTAAQNSNSPDAAQQQPTIVRVGAVSIAIPSPTNGLVEPGPDYRVLFEPLAGAANRLVAAFVPQDQMEAIHAGKAPPMNEYALVEIGRRVEFTRIDPSTFQQISEVMAKQLGGDIKDVQTQSQDELNQKLKSLGSSANVTMDKPIQLGAFFAKTDSIGFGMIMPYNVNGTITRMAGCLAEVRVRDRVLSVFTYAAYKDEGTVKWVKTTAEQWADAILKANQ
ncbi:MAG TPA: hypothetical protein VKB38_06595 [Terracidiphilus sp.]|nr:hypothetical protein [Terracidiphilus sp.]